MLHANSGAAANIGASTAIFGATALGAPISTTHAAASSVVGAGVSSGKGVNLRSSGRCSWIVVDAATLAFAGWAMRAMRNTVHADDIQKEIPAEEELSEFDQDRVPHLKGHPPVE